MKKSVRIFIAAVTLIMASACAKQAQKSYGYILIGTEIDAEVVESTKSHLSDFTGAIPQGKDLDIVISDWDGDIVYEGKAALLDDSDPYLTGEYSVSAVYGTVGEEGPDKPRFYGQSDFTVSSNETTRVNVKAKLSNTILKIKLSENFKSYYSGIKMGLETGSGNSFSISDGSVMFVEPFRFTLRGSMSNPQGKNSEWEKTFESGIEPGCCYTITIDASNIGSSAITIEFNDNIQTVDLGEIDINE